MLAAVGLLAAGLFLAADLAGHGPAFVLVKPIPVLCLAAAQRGGGPGAAAVALGLVASAAGDVLLELPGDHFVAGLLAFLAAHLAYVGAFVSRRPRPAWALAAPFALYGSGMYALLLPRLGGLALPVAAYVCVICAMGWRAAATLGTAGGRLALAGALSFVASDSLLAWDRFHTPLPGVGAWVLLTYWVGQAGIAGSTLAARGR